MSEAKLRDELALSLELHSKEGFIGYNGHVSARIPGSDRILISPYGGGLKVGPADMVTLELSGRVVALGPGKLAPPSESPIHTAIYRLRDDVMAIAHIHPPLSTFFGIADVPIVPVHVSGAVFGAPIPVLDDPDLIKTPAQGDRLARALGAHRAVLIRGHGAVTVGESVQAAFLASLYLEENARHQLFASVLGKPRRRDEPGSEVHLGRRRRPALPESLDLPSGQVGAGRSNGREATRNRQPSARRADGRERRRGAGPEETSPGGPAPSILMNRQGQAGDF
jgi:ribulose-5-phosphate 4-epimerase/fuculose-1-phosphate aldolase